MCFPWGSRTGLVPVVNIYKWIFWSSPWTVMHYGAPAQSRWDFKQVWREKKQDEIRHLNMVGQTFSFTRAGLYFFCSDCFALTFKEQPANTRETQREVVVSFGSAACGLDAEPFCERMTPSTHRGISAKRRSSLASKRRLLCSRLITILFYGGRKKPSNPLVCNKNMFKTPASDVNM